MSIYTRSCLPGVAWGAALRRQMDGKKGPGTNFRGLKTDASPRCSGPGIVHNNCAVLLNQSIQPALQRGTRNVLCACLESAGSPTAVAVISTPCEPGPAAP